MLEEAFSREKIDLVPQPMLTFERASRRRAVLTARVFEDNATLGFLERAGSRLVDIESCPVLVPELNAALAHVRDLLSVFQAIRGDIRVSLLAADNGIDLSFTTSARTPSGLVRELTTNRAASAFIRLCLNGETILERQRPELSVGVAAIYPPPGSFVQASVQAEQAMAGLVKTHLKICKKTADLFSGVGTFALRLAETSSVHAIEGDQTALMALDRAWRETGGKLKAVTHEKRDLFRRPMMAKELKGIDGVVFDPPRAGAEAQCREMAKSAVKKIAAVSCNPTTLARDVNILMDGGYSVVSATPVDQFAHTPHLEVVVLLER